MWVAFALLTSFKFFHHAIILYLLKFLDITNLLNFICVWHIVEWVLIGLISYHHQCTPVAEIPLTLSYHLFLLTITLDKSSRLHLVSASWLTWSVHGRMSPMSLSLLFQQCPACLAHLTWIVCRMGGKWPNKCCFVECCFQVLFRRTCLYSNHLAFIPDIFLKIKVVQPYSCTDSASAW